MDGGVRKVGVCMGKFLGGGGGGRVGIWVGLGARGVGMGNGRRGEGEGEGGGREVKRGGDGDLDKTTKKMRNVIMFNKGNQRGV